MAQMVFVAGEARCVAEAFLYELAECVCVGVGVDV